MLLNFKSRVVEENVFDNAADAAGAAAAVATTDADAGLIFERAGVTDTDTIDGATNEAWKRRK